MSRLKITENIRSIAYDLLKKHPEGMTHAELCLKIHDVKPDLNLGTVTTAICNLTVTDSQRFYKPAKGLFRLLEFKDLIPEYKAVEPASVSSTVSHGDALFPLFAAWLTDELEEVTHAIVLGGDAFMDEWGTPDVIGKFESRNSDLIKGPTIIVSASIGTTPASWVTTFGQACAYKLFSHKSYLVISSQTPVDHLVRMQSLCQIFGVGLATFDRLNPIQPEFKLFVRATKHEPDLFYTNRYIAHIEKELFA
jgi:hypothetical protein